ncbi:hypothetical protein L798_11415 [Zootermopsis nevadensis]|uniref:Uncharacterized protein n=1 Tax=Zootermopsis nevadensis TaxID=136037 RepID=A0A067R7M0_ZOONE|nr:hypothetical protein L798_11415 [Zootermopsis nevadensis]
MQNGEKEKKGQDKLSRWILGKYRYRSDMQLREETAPVKAGRCPQSLTKLITGMICNEGEGGALIRVTRGFALMITEKKSKEWMRCFHDRVRQCNLMPMTSLIMSHISVFGGEDGLDLMTQAMADYLDTPVGCASGGP